MGNLALGANGTRGSSIWSYVAQPQELTEGTFLQIPWCSDDPAKEEL